MYESDVCGNIAGDFVRIPCLHGVSVSHFFINVRHKRKKSSYSIILLLGLICMASL